MSDSQDSLRNIEQHLHAITQHPLLARYSSVKRELLMQFLKGAAFGLGSVAGAGIILSLLIYLLSQIQFVPIIGDLIKDILAQIQAPH
jgi:hypothetical protein